MLISYRSEGLSILGKFGRKKQADWGVCAAMNIVFQDM